MMMGQLLGDVWRQAAWIVDGAKLEKGVVMKDGNEVDEKTGEPDWTRGAVPDGKKEGLAKALEDRIRWHLAGLDQRDGQVKNEINDEESEQKKKITSEDIKEGWSQSTVAPPKPSPLEDKPKAKSKSAAKETNDTIEVLNPSAVASVRVRSCSGSPLIVSVVHSAGRRGRAQFRSPHPLSSRVHQHPHRRLFQILHLHTARFLCPYRVDARLPSGGSIRRGTAGREGSCETMRTPVITGQLLS